MPIAAIFCILFSLYSVAYLREGKNFAWLYLWRPPVKIRDRFKGKTFFFKLLCFWDQNSTKAGQIESYKFSLLFFDQVTFRSNFVLIKCCFNQILFGSSVISIKCRLILMGCNFSQNTCHSIFKILPKNNKHVRISSFNGNTYKKLYLQKIIGLAQQQHFLYKLLNIFYTPLVYFGNHLAKLTKGSSKTLTKH